MILICSCINILINDSSNATVGLLLKVFFSLDVLCSTQRAKQASVLDFQGLRQQKL